MTPTLGPGNRVDFIMRLADDLAGLEWPEIFLILEQFGVPPSSYPTANKRSYLLTRLGDGDNDALTTLYDYRFREEGSSTSGIEEPDFWQTGYLRLFLSHISPTKDLCCDLRRELAGYGVSAFVAHMDIEPTRGWVQEIEIALQTCDAMLAVLTPGFKESSWTDQEVGFCHGRRVLILALRHGLDPYGFISRYQAIQGLRSADQVAADIYAALIDHEKTTAKMADALVRVFENSDSFAEANSNVKRLRDIRGWTPELLRRIETASDRNTQVEGAYDVPSIVQEIIREHGST